MGSELNERSILIALTTLLCSVQAARSQTDLLQLYQDVTESSVDVFEPLWIDYSSAIPNSGYFDFARYQDWRPHYVVEITIPGTGQVAYCYAVLLQQTDKQTRDGTLTRPSRETARRSLMSAGPLNGLLKCSGAPLGRTAQERNDRADE